MRYRKMSPDGDYLFGYGAKFIADTPETVAQAIKTRLALFAGEWFLDDREGLDLDLVLGKGTQGTRDQAVQQRILGTPGVLSITEYASTVDGRSFTVQATVETIYGPTSVEATL